jgi:hypothetical protein
MRDFIFWYFIDAVKFLFDFFSKFLKFILYFFGFFIHLSHLFSPWKHIAVSYGRGLRIDTFLSGLAINGASRFVGATLRLLVIIWTILLFIFILIIGAATILLWICLPVILVYLILSLFIR